MVPRLQSPGACAAGAAKRELRNIEWDGGGMFAQDWDVFLVSIDEFTHRPGQKLHHASSTEYPAVKLGLCVAWILTGYIVSFLTKSMIFLEQM